MKKILYLIVLSSTLLLWTFPAKGKVDDNASFSPTGTYTYAKKDSTTLELDYYAPAENSQTEFSDKRKPTILFLFGGGFKNGTKADKEYLGYFKAMTEKGYGVISIDYRLGMKGVVTKGGISSFKLFYKSIHMAMEDLFSATLFLIEKGESFGVDSNSLVLAGSSAGAISVLQGVWECDRRSDAAAVLPRNFRYAGVMSFAGGVISDCWAPTFSTGVCPMLLFQGTGDKVVEYKKIQVFNLGFFGTDAISGRLKKVNARAMVFRYEGNGHEIAGIMDRTVDIQDFYIKHCVMLGESHKADALITDPTIKKWNLKNTAELYKKK